MIQEVFQTYDVEWVDDLLLDPIVVDDGHIQVPQRRDLVWSSTWTSSKNILIPVPRTKSTASIFLKKTGKHALSRIEVIVASFSRATRAVVDSGHPSCSDRKGKTPIENRVVDGRDVPRDAAQ